MKLPDEVRRLLARRYEQHHRAWLAAPAGQAGPADRWPLVIPLGLPTEAAALRQPEAVRAWAESWRAWRGAGVLQWTERRWRVLGTQRLPESLSLQDAAQVATWLGEHERWQRATARFARMSARWPALAQRLTRLFNMLADFDDADFQRLQDLLGWLDAHPRSGLYPRQIPLSGIDSKWLEPRKGALTELVAALRGAAADHGDFYDICGLARPPALVRMRVLDAGLRAHLGGLSDLTARVADLARIDWRPDTVLIVENLQTGLALGDLPGTVAFMGLGYGVDMLAPIGWIREARGFYWGDIDTHGFAILSNARRGLPHLTSILMDRETLQHFQALWTLEKSQHGAIELPGLTAAEQEVLTGLRGNAWGQSLRLEQERIAWDVAWQSLRSGLGFQPARPGGDVPRTGYVP